MLDDEVELAIPFVDYKSRLQVGALIGNELDERLTTVRQAFFGGFDGSALLVFPREHSITLVRALLEQNDALESMTDLEQDAA